jgi:hypothetical protein
MIQVAQRKDLYAIGRSASQLGVTVRKVEQLATTLNMMAATRIDGIVFFDGAQLETLRDALQAEAMPVHHAKTGRRPRRPVRVTPETNEATP